MEGRLSLLYGGSYVGVGVPIDGGDVHVVGVYTQGCVHIVGVYRQGKYTCGCICRQRVCTRCGCGCICSQRV